MTSDRIEQTRERLRVAMFTAAQKAHEQPYPSLLTADITAALDALVAFERAEARHKDIRDTLDGNEWKQTKAALERICAEVLG